MTATSTSPWTFGSDELITFLQGKRWFGRKGRTLHDARASTIVPVKWRGSQHEYAVARVEVQDDESRSSYQLFVDRDGELRDALDNADFQRGLVDAFAQDSLGGNRGARLSATEGASSWVIESEGATPLVVPPRVRIALSAGEQSNSSIIIDGVAILKLYRRLEPGVHPDVEVTRFLTIDRQFVHVPALLGTIRFEDASGATIAGMLQELVPSAVDGWQYALQTLRTATDKRVPFVQDAEELGRVTRALHETLGSGTSGSGFEQREATSTDLRDWVRAAQSMIVGTNKADARAAIESLARSIGDDLGSRIRTHGDYHLGQVLRSTAGRFLVIDFEGEPTRSLAERRVHLSPLRDVAGMLRSFAYAAAAASVTAGPSQSPGMTTEWEVAVRNAFLDGYFEEIESPLPGLLPRERANADRLIRLFEAEKAFYELDYELAHRPDWAWIPQMGIDRLLSEARS